MRVKAISLSSLAEPPPPPIILLTFGAMRLVRHGGVSYRGGDPFHAGRSPQNGFFFSDNHLIRRLNEITDYIRKVLSLPPIMAAPEVAALPSFSFPFILLLLYAYQLYFFLSTFLCFIFPPPFKSWALDLKYVDCSKTDSYVTVSKILNYKTWFFSGM